jgi:hypothetical protein
MSIDISNWKEFFVKKLFRIEVAKGVDSTDLLEGTDVAYVGAKHAENGFSMLCQLEGFENWVSKGNCIVFVQLGAGSAGFVNYIPNDFIGMNGKISCGYIDNILNPEIGLFLQTILCLNRPKYSFGRSWTGDRLLNTVVKLPIQRDKQDNPIIDPLCIFSDDGYVPDWLLMEHYIKSLHYKPIETINKGDSPLKSIPASSWKEFLVDDIFYIFNGKGITQEEIEENSGDFIAIQSGEDNNGIIGKIDKGYCIEMDYTLTDEPCLTVARTGSAGFISYQQFGCVVGDSAKILLLKNEEKRNSYIYLFLKTILMANKYKYTYGRKVTESKYMKEKIMFPAIIVNGEKTPDWVYMEQYIKSLPYGDRI